MYILSNRKILYLEDLLNGLNNKNRNYVLQNLIQQFHYLNNKNFIKDEFYLLQTDNQIIQLNQLTKQLINSTKQ